MNLYQLFRPLLYRLDAETTHNMVGSIANAVQSRPSLLQRVRDHYRVEDARLTSEVFGIHFKNPIGLAPGFDKYAQLVPFTEALGFGFTELGTFTAMSQEGNDKPRLFRLPDDKALINRMGFNNPGAKAAAYALDVLEEESGFPLPIGINIGKSKTTPLDKAVGDYLHSFVTLYDYASYFTVNVSSPNTPELRNLQRRSSLIDLLQPLQEKQRGYESKKPILLKISPDLESSELAEIAYVAMELDIAALIVANTTVSRDNLRASKRMVKNIGAGGLSGQPLFEKAKEMVSFVYQETKGGLPIIGVGGIMSSDCAFQMIKAGASLVQTYTGFVYEGPGFVKKLNEGLLQLMEEQGYHSLAEVRGTAH